MPILSKVEGMVPLEGRRIALIGGAGFIGHSLALALARRGAVIRIIDSLQHNNLLAFAAKIPDLPRQDLYLRIIHERLDLLRAANVPVYTVDARDYHKLSHLLGEFNPHAIVQLAAIAHAGRSNKDPYSTFDNSLVTLENALDFSRGMPVEQFVFFSSSMVYGDFLTEEVDEDHPLNPIGIYGALKVAGDKLVIAYHQVFDLPYTIIRPSALYGPRCVSRRVGQIFIENALDGMTLRVDGDGSEKLDFTYIDDLVEGVLLVLQHPSAHNQIMNLTYGQSRSISDLLGIIEQYFPRARVESVARDRLMPVRGTLSVAKARRLIGYAPQHPIEVGFAKYIAWYQELTRTAEPVERKVA
jgi:nucleoside-diphosphate-sugar epimerase